jgi:hypothetical protein
MGISGDTVRIKLPPPHRGRKNREHLDARFGPKETYSSGGQLSVLIKNARFDVIFAGRRWGKSMLALIKLLYYALKGGGTWWIWPNRKMARNGWEFLKNMTRWIPGAEIREVEKIVMFGGKGYIQIQSAHDPDALRGTGLHYAVMDEISFMRHGQYIWRKIVRPALAEHQGGCMFITSPNGFDWVYQMWVEAHALDGWQAWRFPAWDNPKIPISEIEALSQELNLEEFLQEVAAQSFAGTDSVFGNVYEYAKSEAQETPIEEHIYTAGLDLARHVDYMALSISDGSIKDDERPNLKGSQIYLKRWKGLKWEHMVEKIIAPLEKYNVKLVTIDATGIGDVLAEQIEDALGDHFEVDLFVFSSKAKTQLIKDYALGLEREEYVILADDVSLMEHQDFKGRRNEQTLHITYEAQTGHDDLVIASALNFHVLQQERFVVAVN